MIMPTKWKALIVLIVLLFSIGRAVCSGQNNLIINGDFESGPTGHFAEKPYPSAWAGWGTNGALEGDDNQVIGDKGLLLWWDDMGVYQDFAAIPGRSYTVEVQARTPAAAPIVGFQGNVYLEWYNTDNQMIGQHIIGQLDDADSRDIWHTIKGAQQAPANAVLGRIVLRLADKNTPRDNSGVLYFDNVSVIGHNPDINDDGVVTLIDFSRLADAWLTGQSHIDLTGDAYIDINDLLAISDNWLSDSPDYELVFADEFDGSSLDLTNWSYQTISGNQSGNNELEHYTSSTKNSFVQNGVLHIKAIEEDYYSSSERRTYHYTSARLRTKDKHDFNYGFILARIKIPKGQGLWPAFWLMPTDSEYGGWAASGEIDIMESVNQTDFANSALHYGGSWPNNTHVGGKHTALGDYSQDYHIYAVEWLPNRVKFYMDWEEFFSFGNWYSEGWPYPAPFDKRFYIILNLAVGGNWPGSPDSSTIFPAEMLVDYVRVYKKVK